VPGALRVATKHGTGCEKQAPNRSEVRLEELETASSNPPIPLPPDVPPPVESFMVACLTDREVNLCWES
jgi:hypothetical protein